MSKIIEKLKQANNLMVEVALETDNENAWGVSDSIEDIIRKLTEKENELVDDPEHIKRINADYERSV